MKIIITVPDGQEPEEYADYVAHVAEQLEEGYTSGHVDSTHHWSSVDDVQEVGA